MLNMLMTLATTIVALAARAPGPNCRADREGLRVDATLLGDRWFVHWHARSGAELSFYTDTGGNTALYGDAVQRLHLGDSTTRYVPITRALNDSMLPPMLWHNQAVPFVVYPYPAPEYEPGVRVDGVLGTSWFMNRVWTLDYPHQRLYLNSTAPTGPKAPECWVPLGFQSDSSGQPTQFYPRIGARIDGDTIQFLLDTGATTTLTDAAWHTVGAHDPKQRAASFITQRRFDAWHVRHPEWLVVQHAEAGDSAPMIRVPIVEVDGQKIGPVWFTERPTKSFEEFMSQYTDRPIEGALGGSAWKNAILILDYPRARAAVLRK